MAVVINELDITPAPAPAAPASSGSGAGGEAPSTSGVQQASDLARALARHRERASRVRAH
ncbi:hypothetical protein D7V97_17655 [Corallococcus sp. CA053C]|uniref:Uncharacterized protein n=1 Tax=Corallococcus sicarius TaxID=2316726 RepID=A0A3A8P3F9_9BACT|nr:MULTISPECIES: hypothetical protein [Corallococcus]RKH09086.1 hypothetical protein D7V97_17655 [Corallococcus sp. CA053C]RKH46952.1 hypothetical protein D7X12_04265 [Corallococcus sicarius]